MGFFDKIRAGMKAVSSGLRIGKKVYNFFKGDSGGRVGSKASLLEGKDDKEKVATIKRQKERVKLQAEAPSKRSFKKTAKEQRALQQAQLVGSMSKKEWAENTVDDMELKDLARLAYDAMLDSVIDMSDKEFQEYLIECGYED